MRYTIRYNGKTNHIEGLQEVTTGAHTDANVTGVVSYYAQSPCASLTRSGFRMAVGQSFETASEALSAAEASAKATGRKLCKNCVKAAKWAISYEFDAESDEFKAEKKRVNDEMIARSEAVKAKYANLSPTAQALAEASDARDEAMQAAYDAEGTDREAEADAAYEAACAARWDAVNAHRKAREANGDFGPRAARDRSGMDSLRDMLKLS